MRKARLFGWVFYVGDSRCLNSEKSGKWMYFFSDKKFAAQICKTAVKKGVVEEAKYSDDSSGVVCFYLNYDDIDAHKRIITYFLKNDLVRRTKTGRLYNISFKRDSQTSSGEYGNDFHADIRLADFLDLNTGEWLV
jgi:hypothetical protein